MMGTEKKNRKEKQNVEYRRRTMVLRYRWKEEVLVCGALIVFAFLVNAGIQIHGLAGDDLYLWQNFFEDSFWRFLFPGENSRFFYHLAACLEFIFVGNHISWFVPVNLVINGLIAYTVFRAARRFSGSGAVGFVCGILYLLSRMSYYQISQVYGLMESLGLWAAVAILYYLYRYLNENEEGDSCYFVACGLYFIVCFINERYMVLVMAFLLPLLFRKEKRILNWLTPAFLFLLVQFVRILTTGTLSPAGVDGTYVLESLRLGQVLEFLLWQLLYLLGINMGPASLCGQPWVETSRLLKLAVTLEGMITLSIFVLFIIRLVCDWTNIGSYVKNAALFVGFIVLCMLSSSVTIRLEMRWIYVSMTAAWLFLAYMCGVVTGHSYEGGQSFEWKGIRYHRGGLISLALLTAYLALTFYTENYYRGFYQNLSFWEKQQEYNSLADQTWGRYGGELSGKRIYILKNTYGISQGDAETFFQTFEANGEDADISVYFVDSIRDFGQVAQNMVILREDPEHQAYQDITSMVRELKCEGIYGYYPDGWMDENAKMRVMAGSTGDIVLELLYPDATTGREVMNISMDGWQAASVKIDQSILYVTLKTLPYRTVELEFENNFYLGSAQEQRGSDRLSIMVNVTAD